MDVLHWDKARDVGVAFMDADHAAAAAMINALAEAEDRTDLLARFIEHCREHFAREEAMMARTGFFATHCHADEHRRVLGLLAEIQARLAAGDRQDSFFRRDLPAWLNNHRDTMDFVTAEFARKAGEG